MHQDQTIRDHATFRAVLQAMSRPGTVQQLPAGEEESLPILLAALLDHEVTLAGLEPAAADLAAAMARHVGCRLADPEQADFLLSLGEAASNHLIGLKRGSAEYPENGATVIFLVERIAPHGGAVRLSGPGIKETATPLFVGVQDDVLRLLGVINQDFPLGIDAMFLDRQGQIICIPRSTVIGES